MRRKTKEEFIKEARLVHGYQYDYSKVNYIDSKTKVCIICPEHGEFWQTPGNHYHYGCMKCGGTYKMDSKTFVNKARKIFGDKYSYDKVIYTTTDAKVIIGCPEHGDFEQTPHDHLGGHGCPICGGAISYTTESFIEAAKKVHGDCYSYNKVEYVKSTNKVIITCPKHGDFKQKPSVHLFGAGCPKCKRSRGEEAIALLLNDLNISYIEQYRINDNFKTRNEIVVDFYIPNKRCIIEYNGAQHYIPMEFFGGKDQLVNQQKRDAELREYCRNNDIKLVEIPYTETNIEEVIIEELK